MTVVTWPKAAPPGEALDVRAIRAATRLSQTAFAQRFGFDLAMVRAYERGGPVVDPLHRVLLTLIAREPEAVLRALATGDPESARRASAAASSASAGETSIR